MKALSFVVSALMDVTEKMSTYVVEKEAYVKAEIEAKKAMKEIEEIAKKEQYKEKYNNLSDVQKAIVNKIEAKEENRSKRRAMIDALLNREQEVKSEVNEGDMFV